MTLRELVALTRKPDHWEAGYAYWMRGKAQIFTVWCDDRWNIIQYAAGPDLRRTLTKLRAEALERINGERDE